MKINIRTGKLELEKNIRIVENECIRLYFLSFPSYCSENAEEEIQTEIDFANNIFHFKGTVVHISSNSPFKKKTWH